MRDIPVLFTAVDLTADHHAIADAHILNTLYLSSSVYVIEVLEYSSILCFKVYVAMVPLVLQRLVVPVLVSTGRRNPAYKLGIAIDNYEIFSFFLFGFRLLAPCNWASRLRLVVAKSVLCTEKFMNPFDLQIQELSNERRIIIKIHLKGLFSNDLKPCISSYNTYLHCLEVARECRSREGPFRPIHSEADRMNNLNN